MSEEAWQTDVYVILAHSHEPAILMRSIPGGWTLPHVRFDSRVYPQNVGPVTAAVQAKLGLEVTILLCLSVITQEDARRRIIVYAAESRQPVEKSDRSTLWVDRTALQKLTIYPPDTKAVIDAYLAESETGIIPELRPPWARRGWFDQAALWIEVELKRLGYTLNGQVRQMRTWGISCLLCAPTTSGDVYFKIASRLPLFAHEPLLMQNLASLFPDHIPAPLSIEPVRAWMLIADFGETLRGVTDVRVWQDALVALGKIQRATVGHDLVAMGCLDRRLSVLEMHIDGLLSDQSALSTLNGDEQDQLCVLGPALKAMCRRLGDYRVPETLMHGDLNAGNVAASQAKILIFDWTDGCLAHPFYDLCPFLLDAGDLPDSAQMQMSMRDAYLALWTDFEPMDRLIEIWHLTEVLGAIHQAVSYQHIVAILEPASKWELDSGFTFWLQRILALVRQSPHILKS